MASFSPSVHPVPCPPARLPSIDVFLKVEILTSFSDLGLSAPLLKTLANEGYATPTPIQEQAIPELLRGRDLFGIAQTGTGKTAAFALPILHHLSQAPKPLKAKSCRALILSPTRELAKQITESFRVYGQGLRLRTEAVYGGMPIGRQMRALAGGVDILVATPGRLIDLIQQRAIGLADVSLLVLDEADQMLDLGFIHPIRQLAAMLAKKRQTMLFSATLPKAIVELADAFLDDPVRVHITPVATTAERVEQKIIFVESARKQDLLHALLKDETINRALVFTRTKFSADRVVTRLEAMKIGAVAIHGNKSQPQRERALSDFKAGRVRLLVATDIAARGIDIDNVSHVINFDLPNSPESYVHRIGRTARAGAEGAAISFCDREELGFLKEIEKLTRQSIPDLENPLGPAAHDRESRSGGKSGKAPGQNQAKRRFQNRGPKRGPERGAERGSDRGSAAPKADANAGAKKFKRRPSRNRFAKAVGAKG